MYKCMHEYLVYVILALLRLLLFESMVHILSVIYTQISFLVQLLYYAPFQEYVRYSCFILYNGNTKVLILFYFSKGLCSFGCTGHHSMEELHREMISTGPLLTRTWLWQPRVSLHTPFLLLLTVNANSTWLVWYAVQRELFTKICYTEISSILKA